MKIYDIAVGIMKWFISQSISGCRITVRAGRFDSHPRITIREDPALSQRDAVCTYPIQRDPRKVSAYEFYFTQFDTSFMCFFLSAIWHIVFRPSSHLN